MSLLDNLMSDLQNPDSWNRGKPQLSQATQKAVALFWRHERQDHYTPRMIELETIAMRNIPPHEMAEFVRLTTHTEGTEE